MKVKLLMILSLSAALAGAAGLDDPVLAAWKPKEGAKLRYRYINHHGGGSVPKMDVSWTSNSVIEKVADGKVSIRDKNSEPEVTIDGAPGGGEVQLGDFEFQYSLRGDVVAGALGNDGHGFLFSLFGGFRFPDRALKVDEEWTLSNPADNERSAVTVKVVYRGKEKIKDWESLKFDYVMTTAADGPATDGIVWVSAEDGALVKRNSKLKRVDFGGGPEEMSQEVERIG